MFEKDSCDLCGRCFEECPVIQAGHDEAVTMIRRLVEGEYVAEVLDRCTGCMSCNLICDRDANPYDLLLDFYGSRYAREGIPGVFRCAMPQRDGPNIWRHLHKYLSHRERGLIKSWSLDPMSEEVVFLGCNQQLTPLVADTDVFGDIPVFTDPRHCCGEYYLRLGLLEQARNKAAGLAERFESLGIKRIIAFCPACHNTMSNLAPRLLGVEFPVEIVGLPRWLKEKISDGTLRVSNPLQGKVTVQDPCHASELGEETASDVRWLIDSTGLEIIEMEHHGTAAECCGLGAALARYRLADVLQTGFRRMAQTGKTGAGRTCAWCNGCYFVMNMFRLLYPTAPPVNHLMDLVRRACGEEPGRTMPGRAVQLVAAAAQAAALDGFRFDRVKM